MDTARLRELVERLVASGPKAAHVSASETHEIHDDVLELIEDRNRLALALRETLEWACSPTMDIYKERHRLGGYTSELIPQFTKLGDRDRTERLTAIASVLGEEAH